MNGITRRGFLKSAGAVAVGAAVTEATEVDPRSGRPSQMTLKEGWFVQSSTLVEERGDAISSVGFPTPDWYKAAMPGTVLSTLVKNGVYPNPRVGLDCYKIPDSSVEFNRKHDLDKFSHLPDRRNPWADPYWYRTEFTLPSWPAGRHVWLNFDCINYRAEVWLNGAKVSDSERMAGMFQRFRFDVTGHARTGRNALAVKIYPVDHPGEPDMQTKVFGPHRNYHKEIMRDVTEVMTIGYDCMMTVPDRNMGIIQDVSIDWTGPIDIRNPFVVTDLPLPDTSRATLAVSAELVNATSSTVRGVLRGSVTGTSVRFEQQAEIGPNETKLARIDPKPIIVNPRLWWPVNYGEQHLYDLALEFEAGGEISDEERVAFGVRKVTSELHEVDGFHGRRIMVNGRKIFCRGGYIQPELMLDWDAGRIETEIRYFAEENTNLIYFEDIPNPPDVFLDACDRHGVLFGNCFYGCYWLCPGPDYQPSQGEKPTCRSPRNYPDDFALLESCTVDLLKRYRNHPSLVMYMAMNEADTREQVYRMWRRHVIGLDGTRFWIPSGYFPDSRKDVPEWFKQDLPTGMNDFGGNKTYGWREPATFFEWVRNDRTWMFKIENGSASLPPISSLARFLPDLGARGKDGAPFPLTETWAHHGANDYYKEYDAAIRRLHGEPTSVADYCWKGHLLTADQHRAFYEAVNHRMWDLTSGFTEWKINSCYPDVQWQNFDYYHKPVVSHYYIKRACEPIHVQMDPLDCAVSVINCRLQPQNGLQVSARVFDLEAKKLWERSAQLDAPANAYREVFRIEGLTNLAPFVFVKLELKDGAGRLISHNFYWLRGQGTSDYRILQTLPMAKLDSASTVENRDAERLIHVRITNPGPQLAFFVQLALTTGAGGDEILPVFWQDNYFSLLPHESREVTARIATRDLRGATPTLEVGGWNVQTGYRCSELTTSKATVKAGEEFTAAARVAGTFLDGSRVTLLVDGRPAQTAWAWAPGSKTDEVVFKLSLSQPGAHELSVADRRIKVAIEA